jgi:RimJ/RimL family protein N-acetyltransferase
MIDPREFVSSETLRNGLAVTVRALRADDRDRMARAIRGLDRESIYTRLMSYRNELTEAGLDRVMRFDPDSEVALVVTIGAADDETIVGAGRYVVLAPGAPERAAEVAYVVEEDYHGLGIAGRLLRHLARIARDNGIGTFEAEVLSGNKPMLAVFERSGLPMHKRSEGGVLHVALALRGEAGTRTSGPGAPRLQGRARRYWVPRCWR